MDSFFVKEICRDKMNGNYHYELNGDSVDR